MRHSDAMRLSGVEDGGQGMLGVNMVTVKDGKATLPDGTIAGSVTNLHAELKNLVSWGIPLETAVRAMTLTPAKEIGMENEIGSLGTPASGQTLLCSMRTSRLSRSTTDAFAFAVRP